MLRHACASAHWASSSPFAAASSLSSPRRAASSSAASSAAEKRLAARAVYTQEKGGMKGYDAKLQRRVIEELSRGSPHHAHALDRSKKNDADARALARSVRALQTKKQAEGLRASEAEADAILAEAHEAFGAKAWWCVLDMDMFYAAVETRDNPKLADLPMVVGKASMVATANYVARRYGVRSAMPGFIARELCKRQGAELVFVKPDMKKYKKAGQVFRRAAARYGPTTQRSLDEVYVDITERVKAEVAEGASPTVAARSVVRAMRRDVAEATGGLTSSGGIGPSRMLAKLAADVEKPNGQFATPRTPPAVAAWLAPQKIRRLPGVGPVMETLLREGLAVETVADLLKKRALLVGAMPTKKKTVRNLLYHAVGVAAPAEQGAQKAKVTAGAEKTFAGSNGGLAERRSQQRALRLVAHEAFEAAPKGRPLYGATLRLKHSDFSVTSRSVHRSTPMSQRQIISAATRMLEEADPERLRLIGLRFQLSPARDKKEEQKKKEQAKKVKKVKEEEAKKNKKKSQKAAKAAMAEAKAKEKKLKRAAKKAEAKKKKQ